MKVINTDAEIEDQILTHSKTNWGELPLLQWATKALSVKINYNWNILTGKQTHIKEGISEKDFCFFRVR